MTADNRKLRAEGGREGGRVGLVLSGGGAKGAYQVGVVKCLAEHNVGVHAIAGASVGALNGAIVASAPDLGAAASRLEKIWTRIAHTPPAEIQHARDLPKAMLSLSLSLLAALSAGNELRLLAELLSRSAGGGRPFGKGRGHTTPATLVEQLDVNNDASLAGIINEFLDEEALAAGLPFYVSVFRSQGAIIDLARAVAGALDLAETPDSEFIHVQSQGRRDFKRCVLASAALPLIFEAQSIGGRPYADGGIGGWLKVQGNTPVTPLLREAGCRYVIVTHLSDGSLWDRHLFPEAVVLEIRPGKPIARRGGLGDTLCFDPSVIAEWMQQGYEDTERCLDTVGRALRVVSAGRNAQERLHEALSKLRGQDS